MTSTRISSLLVVLALLQSAACIFVIHDDGDGTNYGNWTKDTLRGSGVEARETRTLPAFTRIASSGSVEVEAKVGDPQSVVVRADDNLIANLVTEVQDGALVVRWKSDTVKSFSPRTRMKVEVVTPVLQGIALSGSGDAVLSGLAGESFTIALEGSGDVRAGGRVDRLTVSISGSGNLALQDLEARDAHVSIAGSGDIRVNVRDRLDATVAGSGTVRYRGSPQVTRSVAGSGRVQPDGN